MVRWRIFYGDGSVYDDTDGSVESAPSRNVQMIAVVDPHVGWYLVRSTDYYWYLEGGGWNGGDLFGLFDYLIEPGMKRVLFGRTIGNAEFAAVLARALDDPRLPQKSAWYPNEVRP